MRRGKFPAAHDALHERSPIDGLSQRLPDPPVFQHGFGDVDAKVIGLQPRLDADQSRTFGSIGPNLFQGAGIGDVKLSGAEGAFLGARAFNRIITDLIQSHVVAVPVGR